MPSTSDSSHEMTVLYKSKATNNDKKFDWIKHLNEYKFLIFLTFKVEISIRKQKAMARICLLDYVVQSSSSSSSSPAAAFKAFNLSINLAFLSS